ncbi:MAG: hypothetical protein AB7E47_00990 [Desulfovibrionaceae bacterium]
MDTPHRPAPHSLDLTVAAPVAAAFRHLLQQGVIVPCTTGVSVRALLVDQMGLAPDYVEERIQTLFLDSKPVDDLDASVVLDHSTLALSAAMPGLVGATMRRAGAIAAFRAGISCPGGDCPESGQVDGVVYLKCFNLIIDDLGGEMLARGVLVPADAARDIMNRLGDELRGADAVRDGSPLPLPARPGDAIPAAWTECLLRVSAA